MYYTVSHAATGYGFWVPDRKKKVPDLGVKVPDPKLEVPDLRSGLILSASCPSNRNALAFDVRPTSQEPPV